MTGQELKRLILLEARIKEIAEEYGLLTTEIDFEVTTAQRVLEGMSYMFPVNFSHWTFGRDYDKQRTIYDHTGTGIPYEQVWNFERPKALLVETNPFALNVLVIAHVYGHVDFFLANKYLRHGRSFSNIALEARNAAKRFKEYEQRYGLREVEKVIDAGMSVMWHQHPDLFFEEQDEETVREILQNIERSKLEGLFKDPDSRTEAKQKIEKIEKRLKELSSKTPPEPNYDLLGYLMHRSNKPLKPWMVDILTVIRNQARSLAPNMGTKGLNEGWATYWHVRIMRRLYEEKLLTPEEHSVFNSFHSKVTAENKLGFNWYNIFLSFFENIEERWDKGRFGRVYEEERSRIKWANWDTGAGLGKKKIFEIRHLYTDRMAVEELFSNEFIHEQQIYIWVGVPQPDGSTVYIIGEDNPEIIRQQLKAIFSGQGRPLIRVENGNHNGQGHLLLKHIWTGYELDEKYAVKTIEKIHFLWGKKVFLETRKGEKNIILSSDKKNVKN